MMSGIETHFRLADATHDADGGQAISDFSRNWQTLEYAVGELMLVFSLICGSFSHF